MTSTKAPEETSDELKSVTKEFTHQASIKLAELSNDARVSKNFDETLDKASEYLLEEGSEAKIRRKAQELMETSDLAANLKLKSQDLFDNSLRNEEDIETAKRRASRVLEIAESLAAKSASTSQTASVFAAATANLKHLIATSENRQELAEAAKDLGKEVWEKLGNRANENSNVSSMKMTVDRLSGRVRELLRKLQEDKRKREEEAAMAAVMGLDGLSSPRGGMGSDGGSLMNSPRTPGGGLRNNGVAGEKSRVNSRFKTLGEESQSIWRDIRGDEQINKLLKEDIVPGFNSLIRNAVEVSCELISKLELPRVDGIYDSPIGSVCYHVDNLHFSEFSIDKGALRVINHVNGEKRNNRKHHRKPHHHNQDEDGHHEYYDSEYASDDEVEESCEDGGFHQFNERSNSNITGLHSTVEVRGIKTKMEEIEFAYCEHPRGWGVIDGEGLCTVKVDGARVGISYEIIINTPRLVQIVNQGVEIVKNESTRDELTAKFQTSLEERRKASASADENNSEFATPVLSPSGKNPQDMSPSFQEAGNSEKFDLSTVDDALSSALDRAFGGGGAFGEPPESPEDTPPHSPNESTFGSGEQQKHAYFQPRKPSFDGNIIRGTTTANINGSKPGHDNISGNEEIDRQAQLEKNRKFVEDILGAEFLGTDPVLTLRVHTTHIAVGKLDVEIGGTSAAWLYNMIALVLTEQLRGRIEERINNITVRQLARLSGAVAAYSAGLIQVEVMGDQSDSEDYDSDEEGLFSGMTGSLREDLGQWNVDWVCSHCPGEASEKLQSKRKFGSKTDLRRNSRGESMEMLPDLDSDAKWEAFQNNA